MIVLQTRISYGLKLISLKIIFCVEKNPKIGNEKSISNKCGSFVSHQCIKWLAFPAELRMSSTYRIGQNPLVLLTSIDNSFQKVLLSSRLYWASLFLRFHHGCTERTTCHNTSFNLCWLSTVAAQGAKNYFVRWKHGRNKCDYPCFR